MTTRREQLHAIFVGLSGVENAYFQPPPTIQMTYPCIVYRLDDEDIKHADNKQYGIKKAYSATVIDEDPDSLIPDAVSELPFCRFDRFYASDNLNHFVYKIFF